MAAAETPAAVPMVGSSCPPTHPIMIDDLCRSFSDAAPAPMPYGLLGTDEPGRHLRQILAPAVPQLGEVGDGADRQAGAPLPERGREPLGAGRAGRNAEGQPDGE